MRFLVLGFFLRALWLIVEFAVSRVGKEKAEARPQQDAEKSSET